MALEYESCVYIAVDETEVRDVTSIPGIIAGGLVGFIVGGLIGFLFYKLCCHKGVCFNKHRAAVSEEPKHQASVHSFFSYEKSDPPITPKFTPSNTNEHGGKLAKTAISGEEDGDAYKLLDFSHFLADSSWEGMITQLGKRRLGELIALELSQWEERNCCLLQQFRSILNELLSHNVISEPQQNEIMNSEDKLCSVSYAKLKEKFEVYREKCLKPHQQSLLDFFGSFQDTYTIAVKEMISQYRARVHHFSALVAKLSKQDELGAHYHGLLLHHVDTVEGFFRKNQDEAMKSTGLVHKRIMLIISNLAVFLNTEREINKVLSSYCISSVDKMRKTGRISSKVAEELKDSLGSEFSINEEDLHNVLSDINPSLVATYVSDLAKQEQICNDGIQSILHGYENQTSVDGFVESYLTACCEKKTQLMLVSKDFADHAYTDILMNISKLSQTQKKRRAWAIHEFCKHLEEFDALSNAEVEQLRQDFTKRLDATQAKFASICHRNITEVWRHYDDQMIGYLQEENQVDASILQDSVTDNLLSLENFLRLQINLSEMDYQAVMHERESLLLLVVNEINSFRTQWIHAVENDLASSLARLLNKASEDLVTETVAEILGVLNYVWEERSSVGNFGHEIVSVSCISLIMDVCEEEMCRVIARKMITKVGDETVSSQNESILMEEIEKKLVCEISAKDQLTNLAAITQEQNNHLSHRIKDQNSRYSVALSMVEEKLRASQEKRLGRLNVKAQRISQNRPPVGSSSTDLQPYLEQIILQRQVDRTLGSVEFESIQQILLERLRLDGSIGHEILEISNESAAHLLVILCIYAGVSKSDFSTCIANAKKSIPNLVAEQKRVSQRFFSHWKNASHLKTIPY